MSLIEKLTAEAQLARDAFPHGTVLVDGREYRMREDFEVVMERHAAKFARKATEEGAGARGDA